MFNKLCDPAKFYVMLSFVSVIVYIVHLMRKKRRKYPLKELGIHIIILFIWTMILNKVCSFKYGIKISWILVFLPMIFLIIMMILILSFMDELDISKREVLKIIHNAQKEEDDEDALEGFQGCGN